MVLWALSIFPLGVEYGSADSILGMIGEFIAPVFAPLGFGTWQAAVAIIAGLAAKGGYCLHFRYSWRYGS